MEGVQRQVGQGALHEPSKTEHDGQHRRRASDVRYRYVYITSLRAWLSCRTDALRELMVLMGAVMDMDCDALFEVGGGL
jgi:hypothetical protein